MTPENQPSPRVPLATLSDSATALEVFDTKMNRSIRVEVVEPVTITTRESFARSKSFTSYHIFIETDHWAFSLAFSEVRRRYSEFCWLRSKLLSHHPNKNVAPLPPKRYFHMTKFDPKVIEERRYGLGKFLQRVMRSSELLSDAALHLFLQSGMSTEQMDEKLGETPKPKSKKSETRLTPYLLRSLSSGSSASGDGDSSENEYLVVNRSSEAELTGNDDSVPEMNKSGRKALFNPNGQLIQDMISLTITHEDSDEVVQVANSPMEPPILSSLILNSATESGGLLQFQQPSSVK